MKQSIYQQRKVEEKKEKAWKLYQEGLTLREVGKLVNRSYQWVADAIHESQKKNLKKNDHYLLDKI